MRKHACTKVMRTRASIASKRFLGSASSAKRVWENDELRVVALGFADVDTLCALRTSSKHARAVAGADAVWKPHVMLLPGAAGLHTAGYLPSLTFATFLKLLFHPLRL